VVGTHFCRRGITAREEEAAFACRPVKEEEGAARARAWGSGRLSIISVCVCFTSVVDGWEVSCAGGEELLFFFSSQLTHLLILPKKSCYSQPPQETEKRYNIFSALALNAALQTAR
jgi:hypothetical protein